MQQKCSYTSTAYRFYFIGIIITFIVTILTYITVAVLIFITITFLQPI